MSLPACIPHGLTFEDTESYLEHVVTCDRVLPSANHAAAWWLSELKRNGEPVKKKRRPTTAPGAQQSLL